jgi:hypothetical protein
MAQNSEGRLFLYLTLTAANRLFETVKPSIGAQLFLQHVRTQWMRKLLP